MLNIKSFKAQVSKIKTYRQKRSSQEQEYNTPHRIATGRVREIVFWFVQNKKEGSSKGAPPSIIKFQVTDSEDRDTKSTHLHLDSGFQSE